MSTKNYIDVVYQTGIMKLYHDGRVEFSNAPLEDIVQGNSREGRFSNQTPRHYSVAEHSVNVADRVYELTHNPIFALQGLWHEAGEPLGFRDTNSPLTARYGKKWKAAESLVCQAVFTDYLSLPWPIDQTVHQVDHEYAAVEGITFLGHAKHLFHDPGWRQHFYCWTPENAAAEFRRAHKRYVGMVGK